MASPTWNLEQLLFLFIPEMLLLAVWISGIFFALATWNRHPHRSALVLVAMVIFIGQAVFGTIGWYLLMRQQVNPPTPTDLRTHFMNMNLVRSVLQVLGWFIILIAMFGSRQYVPQPMPRSDPLFEEDNEASPPKLPPDAIRE